MKWFKLLILSGLLLTGCNFDSTAAAERLLMELGVERALIINSDDLGMGPSINRAIFNAWDMGAVSSISLQTVEFVRDGVPVSDDVIKEIAQRDGIDVGCHLTINSTDGYRIRPVLPPSEVPSLVDADGFFKDGEIYYLFASREEIRAECRAQIQKALESGVRLTHIDCHQSWGHILPAFKEIYASLAAEFNLPARWPAFLDDDELLNRHGVSIANFRPDHFITLSDYNIAEVTDEVVRSRKQFLLQKLDKLPRGISEVLCHPAASGEPAWRVVDYLVLSDSEVMERIAAKVDAGELALIGYGDLKRVMD